MSQQQCPVCDMPVDAHIPAIEHLGIRYAFCSQQCHENFLQRPALYVGRNAPKRQGMAIHKCRKFRLNAPLDTHQAGVVADALWQLMGIEQVDIRGAEVAIAYDLMQCKAAQIEACLQQSGAGLGKGWSSRLRSGWRQFTEENELDNLAAAERACCNRPPRG